MTALDNSPSADDLSPNEEDTEPVLVNGEDAADSVGGTDGTNSVGGSSVGSAGTSPGCQLYRAAEQYVNLTDADICRVVMKKELSPGNTARCVCGQGPKCTRRSHQDKQKQSQSRAPPLYYPSAKSVKDPGNRHCLKAEKCSTVVKPVFL